LSKKFFKKSVKKFTKKFFVKKIVKKNHQKTRQTLKPSLFTMPINETPINWSKTGQKIVVFSLLFFSVI
jgi:hypothetical protein